MNTKSVDHERWKRAQEWEESHWVKAQQARARFGKNHIWRVLRALQLVPHYRGDDANLWWKSQFDGYHFLPQRAENAIEVGCGPYTNMRLVREVCRPDHIVLSDPLIRTYVRFQLTFVSDMYRHGFCVLDDHPLEDCPFRAGFFDVCIMINVLDHVRNADLCAERAIDILKPGGYLVFGQDLKELPEGSWDADAGDVGHPIKLDRAWIEDRLVRHTDVVFQKILPREASRDPTFHTGCYLFAGRKK